MHPEEYRGFLMTAIYLVSFLGVIYSMSAFYSGIEWLRTWFRFQEAKNRLALKKIEVEIASLSENESGKQRGFNTVQKEFGSTL